MVSQTAKSTGRRDLKEFAAVVFAHAAPAMSDREPPKRRRANRRRYQSWRLRRPVERYRNNGHCHITSVYPLSGNLGSVPRSITSPTTIGTSPASSRPLATDRATLLEYNLISMSRLSAALSSAPVRKYGARIWINLSHGLADSSVHQDYVLHAVIMIGGLKKRNIKTAHLARVCEDCGDCALRRRRYTRLFQNMLREDANH
jgi:hypothetical protein